MRLKKRKFKLTLPAGEINVVSLMDILTTLLFFLLIVASFSRLSFLTGSGVVSQTGSSSQEEMKPKFALQVIFNHHKSAFIWFGPYASLEVMNREELNRYLSQGFQGDEDNGYLKKIEAPNFQQLLVRIQESLIPLKKSFPMQLDAVMAIPDVLKYQEVIDAMGAVRGLSAKQKEFEVVDFYGTKQLTKVLFPSIVLSEWTVEKSEMSEKVTNQQIPQTPVNQSTKKISRMSKRAGGSHAS